MMMFERRVPQDLIDASSVAGQELSKLVQQLMKQFNISQYLATLTAGVIVSLMADNVGQDKAVKSDIAEIIESLKESTNDFN